MKRNFMLDYGWWIGEGAFILILIAVFVGSYRWQGVLYLLGGLIVVIYNGALAINWIGWRDRLAERQGANLTTPKLLAYRWILVVFGLVVLAIGAWLLVASI